MKNIILIGMPFSGKSAVGERLSQLLQVPFLDMDKEIERKYETSISDIFISKGEEFFREAERTMVGSLLNVKGTVVATGGGTPMFHDNYERLCNIGNLVFLKAPIELLIKRAMEHEDRPLLMGEKEEQLRKLYSQRMAIYSQASFVIDITDLSIEDICKAIMRMLNLGK